ncbi:MAG: HAMP domain-containing sensor histidine kinase [bacterium]
MGARHARSVWERLGIVYGLLAIAEVLVLLLAWQSNLAFKRQRATVEQNLVEFAKFGATNFAYRSGGVLANHAERVSAAVNLKGSLSDAALLANGRRFVDSLALCNCEGGLRVASIVLLDSAGSVVTSLPTPSPALPAHKVAEMMARIRGFDFPVLTVRSTDETGVAMVIGLARVIRATGLPERFVLTTYDVDDVRLRAFGFIYNARPPLMPSVFGAQSPNERILALRVVLAGGTVLYQSPTPANTTFRASIEFGPDSAVHVQAALSPAAARAVPGAAELSYRSQWVLVATLIATAVIALIALLLHRTAHLARLRGDFTAAVSHELRTPLTEIMLYAELIHSGRAIGTAPTREAAQVILAEARRLYHLVENVLVIARTDRRMLRVRLDTHDLVPIVRDTVAGFGPLAAKRRVNVTTELPSSLFARCDPSAVAGVLLNLLDNAVRYGPEHQTVVVRGTEVGADAVAIEVDDAGAGIPPADRRRVLEPYVRLERDIVASTSGSGLGLAVVAALVTEMHGTLSINSSARGGAALRVTLPASPADSIVS